MFNSLTKEQQLAFLEPLISISEKMLLAGTLAKNVIKYFTNKGLAYNAANNIVEIAQFRVNKLTA